MTTRAEHLEWVKRRALAYVDRDDLPNAMASLTSDLRKHRETANHPAPELMMMLAMAGLMTYPTQVRDFINGVR